MALSILDGTQTATTLSTILSSGQHITAHTVVSLGTQAKTDILSAVSSGIAISGTVTLGAGTAQIGSVTASNLLSTFAAYSSGNSDISVNIKTVAGQVLGGGTYVPVEIREPIPAGTNRIGVVTIGGGTVTIGAGTAKIGSVTASISGTVQVDGVNTVLALQDGNGDVFGFDRNFPVDIVSALPAGTNRIGTVTANTFAVQGTAVTTSNFTSTTASTVLANYNATREVLTIFNEGAGNLHIAPGATCTTIAYQVRLSTGDYYEVPNHQTTITHSAVFATAGTARVTQIS